MCPYNIEANTDLNENTATVSWQVQLTFDYKEHHFYICLKLEMRACSILRLLFHSTTLT